jgi:hypothetical protein
VTYLSRRTVVVTGFVLGVVLWLAPTLLFAGGQPWDGKGPAYPLVLLAAGLLLGFLGPGRPGAAATGLFLGQLVVLLWRVWSSPETSELWLVSLAILAGYTYIVTGIGALVGSFVRHRFGPRPQDDRRVSDRRL